MRSQQKPQTRYTASKMAVKISRQLVPSVVTEEKMKVLVIYDLEHRVFASSARLVFEMYQKHGKDNAELRPLIPETITYLETFCSSPRFLIHYIGHGLNSGESDYPEIMATLPNGRREKVGLVDVHNTAPSRTSTVIIYDCCNSFSGTLPYPQQHEYPALGTLLTFRGHLTILSSRPGSQSFFVDDGTLFTAAFQAVAQNQFGKADEFVSHLNVYLRRLYKNYGLPLPVEKPIVKAIQGDGDEISILPQPLSEAEIRSAQNDAFIEAMKFAVQLGNDIPQTLRQFLAQGNFQLGSQKAEGSDKK